MKTVIEDNLIENFGKNVTQTEIDEMKELVTEQKILNVFNDQNNIFGDNSRIIHIDARYINDTKMYKIDVQRKGGDNSTIGIAFISEAVKKEIDNAEDSGILHGLYVNVVNALERSMNEIKSTQTQDAAGTSRKYTIRTNDGR